MSERQKMTKQEVLMGVIILVIGVVGTAFYYAHQSDIQKQQAAQALKHEQQVEANEASLKQCEADADAPYEAVLMYDPTLYANAAPDAQQHMAQANQACEQEYPTN